MKTNRYLYFLALSGCLWWSASAGAQTNSAACCMRAGSAAYSAIGQLGSDQDEAFFTAKGAPPNLMFMLDTSGSMQDLPIQTYNIPTSTRGTGCDGHTPYDDIISAGAFNMSNSYPPIDLGIAPCPGTDCWNGDSGFPDLFHEADFYRYGEWGPSSATARTKDSACNSYAANVATCKTCLDTKGYYLHPTNSSRGVFSGKFLNFYPPKYVVGRTVLKKVIWDLRKVRFAVSKMNGTTGAVMIDKLNPPCDKVLDPNDSSWDNNRKSTIGHINSMVDLATSTPLAETLLNIGQYFTTDDSVYNNWFGTGWTINTFRNGSITSEDRSVCWGCQVSSVVLITDGLPCNDNCIPECIRRQGVTCTNCDQRDCGCAGTCPNKCGNGASCKSAGTSGCCKEDDNGGNGKMNQLPNVAKWLFEHDLQTTNPANGRWSADGRQKLITYTVGFGIDLPLLATTAQVGGGQYYVANDRTELENALKSVVDDINKRATTFGMSSISTLQTTSQAMATFVPRFIPGSAGEEWKGMLYRFNLVSEYINGCQPHNQFDLDDDGACDDVFYSDADGDMIEEDPITGKFVKRGSSADAVPFWESGSRITDPDARKLWTVLDDSNSAHSGPDGLVDRNDTVIPFDSAHAAQLMPYMQINTDVTNDSVCGQLYDVIVGTPTPTPPTPNKANWGEECAKVIIEYFRGKKANNADPALRSTNRSWLLNDVFHSSPIMVDPPISRDMCGFYRSQCLPSVYEYLGGGTNGDTDAAAAWDAYLGNSNGPCGTKPCEARQKYVLIGSNGGFLHAIDAGGPRSGYPRDTYTKMIEYDVGTGDELWGFIPPDLLGKLKYNLDKHAYYVDGTALVRDVWVDGDDLAHGNGVKEASDFHTVAVVGERSGGNSYFALDLTKNLDPTGDRKPSFLWMWPQPCDPIVPKLAQSWTNFFPKPPPIGPVHLDAATTGYAHPYEFKYRKYNSGSKTFSDATAQVQERWVAMLSGGYDPALVRGRGVAMVDVYSGKTLWDFFFDPHAAAGDMRKQLMYPVVAGVGMSDMGSGEEVQTSTVDRSNLDDIFDGATFGDMGGNLWTARFYEPGHWDTSSQRVDNWWAARSFTTARDASDQMKQRRPFTNIATNVLLPNNNLIRVYAGTGNRQSILGMNGGTCSVDDLLTCITMGCDVTSNYEIKANDTGNISIKTRWVNGLVTESRYEGGACVSSACFNPCKTSCNTYCTESSCTSPLSDANRDDCLTRCTASCPAACQPACDDVAVTVNVDVKSCPSSTTSGTDEMRRQATFECTKVSSTALNCALSTSYNDITYNRNYVTSAISSLPLHRFLGLHVLGNQSGANGFTFSDQTSAAQYDAARSTETDLTSLGTLSGTSLSASSLSRGWYIDYDGPDEKTASPASVTPSKDLKSSCVLWNTLTPSVNGTLCSGTGNQYARLVQADALTGAVDCAKDLGTLRFSPRSVLIPPPEPQSVMMLSQGKVIYGSMFTEPGQNPRATVSASESDLVQSHFQMQLNQQEHLCRHVDAKYCAP